MQITGLRAEKNGKEILRGVDLEVKRGTHVILGPNGAGKSTLLRVIAGVGDYKVSGSIRWMGEEITGLPPHERAKRGIALAWQFPPELEGVRVEDLEGYIGEIEVPEEFRGRPLFVDFSGGERKILELLISLALRPKLLMVDEPDSGVDARNIRKIGEVLERCRATKIIVTHTMKVLDYLSVDRAYLLENGRIVMRGGLEEVRERYEGR